MESQKVLEAEKTIVISDYREREVADHLKSLGASVSMMNLEIGDFVCSNRIVIERKDHRDYVSSIIDGRLFDQVTRMKTNFERGILIVEGSSDVRISENAYLASVAKMVVDNGISLITTKNPQETAKTIFWIAKKEQDENKNDPIIRLGKKPKDLRELQEWVVASLPGVSGVISKRMLEHFGSVEKIFAASEDELTQVQGVGKSLAKKIREVTGKKY